MTLKEKLWKAWSNRHEIAEGVWNTWVTCSPELEAEAQRRLRICEANTCGLWDSTGTSDKLLTKGKPGCTGCGCVGEYKVHCFHCNCTLKDLGQTPLWEAIIDEDMNKEVRQKEWEQQFKNK